MSGGGDNQTQVEDIEMIRQVSREGGGKNTQDRTKKTKPETNHGTKTNQAY